MSNASSGKTNDNEKEILLHQEGSLIPGKRPFVYHSFSVPEYTVSIRFFLEGNTGRLFLAVFDPVGVRGSRVGNPESENRLIDLRVSLPESHPKSERYLRPGLWKALIDCDDLRETVPYYLSVWIEKDRNAFLYPWLKPGRVIENRPGVQST